MLRQVKKSVRTVSAVLNEGGADSLRSTNSTREELIAVPLRHADRREEPAERNSMRHFSKRSISL